MNEAKVGPNRSAANELPLLRCLGGAQAPADMGEDLRQLLTLPAAAREQFWVALQAYLRPELDEEAQRAITDYCMKHDVEPAEVAPPVKATRHLFRESIRRNSSKEELSTDVHALVDDDDARDLLALLLPWFEDFRPLMRKEMIRQTIADHGKVVVDTHWRVEHITSSDRGDGLNATVAVMTFNYLDGPEQRRVTLHFLPDQVGALRDAANEMLA